MFEFIRTKNNSVIIFSDDLVHADVASRLFLNVESAGFIGLPEGVVNCCGKSVSLGVTSMPEKDNGVINKIIRGY